MDMDINDSSKNKQQCYSPIPCDMGEVMNSSIECINLFLIHFYSAI
jgi:hypothetical protein